MSGRTGGGLIFCRRHLSVNTISTDLDRFNVRLLARDHAVILSSSVDPEPTFDAGMILHWYDITDDPPTFASKGISDLSDNPSLQKWEERSCVHYGEWRQQCHQPIRRTDFWFGDNDCCSVTVSLQNVTELTEFFRTVGSPRAQKFEKSVLV